MLQAYIGRPNIWQMCRQTLHSPLVLAIPSIAKIYHCLDMYLQCAAHQLELIESQLETLVNVQTEY